MRLEGKRFGEGAVSTVILHGLLGSTRNWAAVAADLSEAIGACLALDLRNHGQSGHVDGMSFAEMAGDVEETLDAWGLERVLLIGHSLGGKVAMRFAVDYPDRVAGLVVADIAPRAYPPHFEGVIDLLRRLPVGEFSSRQAVDTALTEAVPDWGFRQFLLTNLGRKRDGGGFFWVPNLEAIHRHRAGLADNPLKAGDTFAGPTLFIRGGRSAFVRESDAGQIAGYFPNAEFRAIEDAGHNVHFETREEFVQEVSEWHLRAVVPGSVSCLNN